MGLHPKGAAEEQAVRRQMSAPEPILAVFLDENEQSYQVRLTTCGLPAEGYGMMLYDIVRHVARMFAKNGQFTEAEVEERILEWFEKERDRPTSDIQTELLQ